VPVSANVRPDVLWGLKRYILAAPDFAAQYSFRLTFEPGLKSAGFQIRGFNLCFGRTIIVLIRSMRFGD
jgi:hypothetical protein